MSIDVSIVIPVYNEEGNVKPLIEGISKACASLQHEILIVNDGSTDRTMEETRKMKETHPQLRILNLKRNFGQTAAMAAGIDHSKGDIIIPMDGDGQNDPIDILSLVKKMGEGYDVVSGWRKNRKDPFLTRKLPSWMANALISYVTGVHLHDYGCSLKAYRAKLIKNVQLHGEMHRFLPAWCAWMGGRISEVVVNHHPRRIGQSKYGLFRIVKVVIDLMTVKFFSGYLNKPNYLFSGSGLISLGLSFITAVFTLYDKYGPDHFPNYRIPLLLLSMFLGLLSVALVFLGLIAEILVRLYYSVRNQTAYVLDDEEPS